MDIKSIVKRTGQTLSSYLTYEAMRAVVDQLRETDPPRAHWLASFSSSGNLQDGEAYLQELLRANRDLAFRIMTVRQHLAEEVLDFLPERVGAAIAEANLKLRCAHLEQAVGWGEDRGRDFKERDAQA
ncbi:MAG: RbcX chaperonin protein [Oscillatoriales cyanobacterium SM2_1_8]|nr:RbcX chaperonin protein [Oscillatoriales cyanobacterium SM2_1_8]